MIIQHKGLEKHFKQIQKLWEFRFLGITLQVNKIQSWVFVPALRSSSNKKTRYALKIGVQNESKNSASVATRL